MPKQAKPLFSPGKPELITTQKHPKTPRNNKIPTLTTVRSGAPGVEDLGHLMYQQALSLQ